MTAIISKNKYCCNCYYWICLLEYDNKKGICKNNCRKVCIKCKDTNIYEIKTDFDFYCNQWSKK